MDTKSVVIIEDDPDLGALLEDILQECDLDTELIQDGDSAVTRLSQVQPDLIVLDMHLPGVSGLELLEIIRADRRLTSTKVIVLSADPLIVYQRNVKADMMLLKPVRSSQIRQLTARLLAPATA